MNSYENRKRLEQMATIISGIEPITDYEYCILSYLKISKGKTIQCRKKLFRTNKKII
jgi:hypothetical protein